jgi:hypothetical protein
MRARGTKKRKISWLFTAPVSALYVTKSTQSKVVGALRAPTKNIAYILSCNYHDLLLFWTF